MLLSLGSIGAAVWLIVLDAAARVVLLAVAVLVVAQRGPASSRVEK